MKKKTNNFSLIKRDMERSKMGLFFSMLLMFLVPAIIIAGPVWWLGRIRVQWFFWEYFTLLVPFLMWIILILTNLKNKSLSNAGIEALIIGIFAGSIQILRVVMPELYGSRLKSALFSLAISVIFVVLLYFFMPSLPE